MGISDKEKGLSGRESGGRTLKEKRRSHFQGLSSSLCNWKICLFVLELES